MTEQLAELMYRNKKSLISCKKRTAFLIAFIEEQLPQQKIPNSLLNSAKDSFLSLSREQRAEILCHI